MTNRAPGEAPEADLIVVGAGGCGLTAALVAAQAGRRVFILESNREPGGSTAMSSGLIVAAGSRLQAEHGEEGTADALTGDVLQRNGQSSDPEITRALCAASGKVMDWLVDIGVELEHLTNYRYEGMTRAWLHAPPSRHGADLVHPLTAAIAREAMVDLRLETPVTGLLSEEGRVVGVTALEDGAARAFVAPNVLLAAAGFAGNPAMAARHIPEMADAPYFGGDHADGGAIRWAQALGAAVDHMASYQAHSSIAVPEMMLVSTYLINHGALQVNAQGERFGDETLTYERHAAAVQAQPNRTVVEIFDERILQETLANYPRFAECQAAGIVHRADSLAGLASIFDLDPDILNRTLAAYEVACRRGHDAFGRTRFGEPLRAPFYGITVTSALVQTLGGLRINARGQVLRADGSIIPGLYAGGGTAAGFAGDRPEGYLAGMGLLAAFGLGWIAGNSIARGATLSA